MNYLRSLLLLILLFPATLFAEGIRLKVVSVHDGDTLTAVGVDDDERYKVRLMGVDTPEVDFYKNTQGDVSLKARDALRAMAPEGSILILSEDSDVDKHGRILGRLLKDGKDLNEEMLRQGWGLIYFIYPFDKGVVSKFSKAAKEAFDNKRGVFSNEYKETEAPYLFRLRVRKQVGRNPVGDFELKKVLSPEDIEQIPVWKRVFFPDYDLAYKNGYN
ncbi:thermonuclease family protein [Bdellovibrio sp. BCCA]|uniref:thermonuclease family protein n=1 Tax=Bdellovibrio sp. BCCA TaxID=3136281 RepID=UPI0030F1531E